MAAFLVDRFARNRYLAFGVLGCMACLIVEAALVANFVPSTNQNALRAAVAMLFVFQVFYGLSCDGRLPSSFTLFAIVVFWRSWQWIKTND